MDFTPHTDAERKEMLAAIGVANFKDLVKDLPLSKSELNIPSGLSEGEVIRLSHELASKNQAAGAKMTSYLGAGAYDHFSPAAVSALMSRGEFLTSYTPYQPEVSQGTLQTLYEFQSMICELMAMDVTNAGMYEGASSLAEAILLAIRETGRKKILLPRSLHPDYKTVASTYTLESGVELIEIPFKNGQLDMDFVKKHLTSEVAAVIVQTPNFFGIVEPAEQIAPLAQAAGALYIACVNPISLGLLTPPGEFGADIAVAERQCLGIPLATGDLFSGFLPARQNGCAKCLGAWWAKPLTSMENALMFSHCKRASRTFAARRRPRTSVQRPPSSPLALPFICHSWENKGSETPPIRIWRRRGTPLTS